MGEKDGQSFEFGPALSLSYDGGDPSHRETVLPCLSQYGLKGTFYLTEASLLEAPQVWQSAQNEGHEIGCHCLLEAADAYGNLPKWTLENVEADLRQARHLWAELFPRQPDCSFAYPGVESLAKAYPYHPVDASYVPIVERLFEVARSAREGLVDPGRANVGDLESVDCRDLSRDDLIVAAEAAVFEARWVIFAFRGIGSGEGSVDASAHDALCAWISERREWFRLGTVFDLGCQLRERRAAAHGEYSWSLAASDPDEPTMS